MILDSIEYVIFSLAEKKSPHRLKVLLAHGCLKLLLDPKFKCTYFCCETVFWGKQSASFAQRGIGWWNKWTNITRLALHERHSDVRNLILPFAQVCHFSVSSSPGDCDTSTRLTKPYLFYGPYSDWENGKQKTRSPSLVCRCSNCCSPLAGLVREKPEAEFKPGNRILR